MRGCLPDFLGIGVQKGGTTTLHRLLKQHPDVFLPAYKEVHYFSLHYGRGDAWYCQQFSSARRDQCCGEITPYYIFHPEVPQRVRALLPQVKLILLLRDPVERALSQVFHSRRIGLETFDLDCALKAETERLEGAERLLAPPNGRHQSHQEHSYLARSRYDEQLARWCKVFSPDQLFIRRSEDLFSDMKHFWAELLQFLHLPHIDLPQEGRRVHEGTNELDQVSTQVLEEVRARLHDQLKTTYFRLATDHGLSWEGHTR